MEVMNKRRDFRFIYDLCDRIENLFPVSAFDLMQIYRREYEMVLSKNICPYYVMTINTFLLSLTQKIDIMYSLIIILEKFASFKDLYKKQKEYMEEINEYSGLEKVERQFSFCRELVGVRNATLLVLLFDNQDELDITFKRITE